ncbi:hypothetical protein G5V59_14530 [Nocardioides sp. W3-2-3]|nr:hypothetical protein [Nocardioides convexus]
MVAWTGPADGVAIDAEIERPVPPALAAAHGAESFWERWTRLECRAKPDRGAGRAAPARRPRPGRSVRRRAW